MNDLDDTDYDEWNAEWEAEKESRTCPGCGKIHAPSKDCDGTSLVLPPKGGEPSESAPPINPPRTSPSGNPPTPRGAGFTGNP